MKDILKAASITILLIVGSLVLILIAYILCYEIVCKETVYKTVIEIGGCNRYSCAVRYSDGEVGEERLPLLGEKYPVCVVR